VARWLLYNILRANARGRARIFKKLTRHPRAVRVGRCAASRRYQRAAGARRPTGPAHHSSAGIRTFPALPRVRARRACVFYTKNGRVRIDFLKPIC